jgi:CBS domain-containing protein
MRSRHITHLPVADPDGRPVGLVARRDAEDQGPRALMPGRARRHHGRMPTDQNTQNIGSATTVPTAVDLMTGADGVVPAGAPLREVVDDFTARRARHLVVLDAGGRCVAVLGPRQIAQAHRVDPRANPDAPIETLELGIQPCLRPQDGLDRCAEVLVGHDLDAVPVLDEDRRLLGLVTVHAVVRAIAAAARR